MIHEEGYIQDEGRSQKCRSHTHGAGTHLLGVKSILVNTITTGFKVSQRPYHLWILVLMVELGSDPIICSEEPTYHILESWDSRGTIHLIQEMEPGNVGLLGL